MNFIQSPLFLSLNIYKKNWNCICSYQDNPDEKKSSKKNKDQAIANKEQQPLKESKKKDAKKSK